MITRTFKLCLNAGTGSAPYINVSQYDEGETWLFELYSETGERYIPSTGAIVGVKSDGHGIINTGTVDNEGRVVITETQQMTASAGRAIFELSIDGLTHGTANFIVAVERKPTDDAVMSDSDLSLIQEAVDSAEVIVEVIGDSDPSEVIGEHVDAWLDAHPEATTTVQDGAITAPKINNSLWDKLLVSESASGAVASFDDGADDVPVSSLKVNLEPIQTGTGDPSPSNVRPIIAANGKNMIPITLANLQTNNTLGTWNGNAYTYRGVTYTVNTNGGGGVISITANGTATYESSLVLVANINALLTVGESYTMTGCPSGGASDTYWCSVGTTPSNGRILTDYGSSATTTYTSQYDQTTRNAYVAVARDYTATDVTFMPQIELGSTASAYQPYQGIMVERKGKNLLPKLTAGTYSANNATVVVDDDGTMHLSGTTNTYGNVAIIPLAEPLIISQAALDEGLYFHFNNSVANSSVSLNFEDDSAHSMISVLMNTENKIFHLDSSTPNLNINVVVTRIRMYLASGVTISGTVRPMLAMTGEVGTSYEPYTSASYPYTLGQSVYGGTVDLATGVLTVTHFLYVYDGTEPFSKSGTALNGFYNNLLSSTPHNWPRMTNYGVVTELTNECSSMYVPTRNVTTYKNNYGYVYLDTGHNFNSDPELFGTTVESFTAKLAELYANGTPVSVFCRIAEPQTIQLTPTEVKTLLGYNTISSSGTVEVIYHADTKLCVDKMTNVDNSVIAPTEATFTATRNYTVNDLVIVNDTLYKVTANIATGSAITPNSNVTATTLSALIKALS